MAPGLVEPQFQHADIFTSKIETKPTSNSHKYIPGRTIVQQYTDTYEYEDLRPRFPDITWPAYQKIPYIDKGQLGDPSFRNLLADATDVFDYNPKIGTEVHGVDLANLTDDQKNDLARLIAMRGVVFFRNQKNFGIDEQRALGQYFGELHRHATTGVPKREGLEDVHVIYTGENSPDLRALFTPTFLWHSDVSHTLHNRIAIYRCDLGNLRSPAPIIYIPQGPLWSTPRWGWRYFMELSIRCLRHALPSHAEIPRVSYCAALGRTSSPRVSGSWPHCTSRARHHRTPFDPDQPSHGLEEHLFQPRLRHQNCWRTKDRK